MITYFMQHFYIGDTFRATFEIPVGDGQSIKYSEFHGKLIFGHIFGDCPFHPCTGGV